MILVTKDSFFATVGQLDVHPHIAGAHDPVDGYTSSWETPQRHVLGRSFGIGKTAYYVTPEFFEKNRAALVRVPS